MLIILFSLIILTFPSLTGGECLPNPTAIEFSTDNKHLYIGDIEGNLYKWDIENSKITQKVKVHHSKITTILPNFDGSLIFTASFDKSIAIIKDDGTKDIHFLKGHEGAITSLSTIPEKDLLISGSADMTVRAWNIKERSLVKTYDKFDSVITAITSFGDTIFAGTSEGYVYLINLSDDEVLTKINLHEGVISSMAVVKDVGYLITSSWDRTIGIWDIREKRLLYRCRGHEFWVTSVVTFKDKILSAGSLDYTLRIWDLKDCKETMKLKGLNSYVAKGIISKDGKHIFSLTLNDGISEWNALTGEMTKKISLEVCK